jgi:hydroxymethylpyrimidine pyrophosphatase-like HAD family hydrolase
MNSMLQAIAIDYDGTLTDTDVPDFEVLAAVREARARGQIVVLVTGRILSELRADFPAVDSEFDAIVAENGAVLADASGVRGLAEPVDLRLGHALAHRDVPVRQGRVLMACDAKHADTVFEEADRLGIDHQLVRNRAALMVLPGGITKGTGLAAALGELGISRHSTIGVGDAENDHHLLAACELGVAVANAVEPLKRRADLVLDEPAGTGVAALLRSPLLQGNATLPPRHWRLTLGEDEQRQPVHIPASQVNLLLIGGSCSGKSHLAGLLVEQLAQMEYSVLVIDGEGDHVALAERQGTIAVGGSEPLPTPEHLSALLRHRFGSVVLDLSHHDPSEQDAYLQAIAPIVLAQRATTGLPHWVFVEEAHTLPVGSSPWADALAGGEKGFCLSTYRPELLPHAARAAVDLMVVTAGDGVGDTDSLAFTAAEAGLELDAMTAALGHERGRALLVGRQGDPAVAFTVAERDSIHVRHWHKYSTGQLPPSLRFYFERPDEGRVAGNLREFHRHLNDCQLETISQHAHQHDFSRWIGQVLKDEQFARAIERAEDQHRHGRQSSTECRTAITKAIEGRYLE